MTIGGMSRYCVYFSRISVARWPLVLGRVLGRFSSQVHHHADVLAGDGQRRGARARCSGELLTLVMMPSISTCGSGLKRTTRMTRLNGRSSGFSSSA